MFVLIVLYIIWTMYEYWLGIGSTDIGSESIYALVQCIRVLFCFACFLHLMAALFCTALSKLFLKC